MQALKLKACASDTDLRAAFDRVDTDGSGYVSLVEVTALLREALGSEPSEFQVKSFLAYFDK